MYVNLLLFVAFFFHLSDVSNTCSAGAWTKITKNVLSNGCTIALVSSSFGASPEDAISPSASPASRSSDYGVSSISSSALHKECELIQAEAGVDGCCPYGILLSLDFLPPFNKQVASDICGVTFESFEAFERWIFESESRDKKAAATVLRVSSSRRPSLTEEEEDGVVIAEADNEVNIKGQKQRTSWISYVTAKSLPVVVPASGHSTIAASLMYALVHNFHLHVTSISEPRDLELIKKAKAQHVNVTCQVSTAELFDKPQLLDYIDVIDVIGVSQKLSGKFAKNIQDEVPQAHALSMLLNTVNEGLLDFEELVEKLHTNPHKIFKFLNNPEDHVEVDMARHWALTTESGEQKTGTGSVFRVSINGEAAYIDGKVVAKPENHTGTNMVIPHEHIGKVSVPAPAATTVTTIPTATSGIPIPTPTILTEESSFSPSTTPLRHHRGPALPAASPQPTRTVTPTRSRPQPQQQQQSPQHQPHQQHHQQQHQQQLSSSALVSAFPMPVPLPLPKTPTGLFHILSVKQFDRNQLHTIFAVAHEMRMMVSKHFFESFSSSYLR